MDMEPTFQGEVMLLAWSETHNGGAKITLQLADPDDLEPFKTMTVAKGKTAGQRLMCVLVEIGDDELPIPRQEGANIRMSGERITDDDRNRRMAAAVDAMPVKGGPLAKLAGRWCNETGFQLWLQSRYGLSWDNTECPDDAPPDVRAAATVRDVCSVASRAEFDNDEGARARFDHYIRHPYAAHLQGLA